jgi:hypothetical protein
MGDSLDSYRSRIGGFAARLCRKMSSSAYKSRKRQKMKEELMALVGIRKDSWDFWSNILTLVMILVAVLSLVDLSLSTVSVATMDGALLGQHNGHAVTRPISVSVIKSLLLESGVESNPGPDSDISDHSENEESFDDGFGEEGQQRELFFNHSQELNQGVVFESQEKVRENIKAYCDRTYVPMIIVSSSAGNVEKEERGRIRFKCTHGHKRKSTAKKDRPWQQVNFTGCPCFLNINENKDGHWVLTKLCLDHQGHIINRENYLSYPHVRKLTDDDLDFVKLGMEFSAAPRNVAEALSRRTGQGFKRKV